MGVRCGLAKGLALAVFLLGLSATVFAQDAARSEPPKNVAPDEPAAEKSPAGKDDPLSGDQELIVRRFRRFEDTLFKIAESLRKSDPDRSDLLIRAIGRIKEDRITQQMGELIQLLRENKQLGSAIDRQDELVTHLHSLLDLLLSEDRQKELKEEQARLKKYIEEVNKLIAREKANRADTERGAPADEIAAIQKKIAEQAAQLSKQMSKEDEAKDARSKSKGASGKNQGQPGQPKSEDGQKGDPSDKPGNDQGGDQKTPGEKPEPGKSGVEKPDGNKSEPGESKPGKSGDEKSPEDKPGEGKPAEGQPQEGKPSEGKPSEGKPSEGKPSEGKPSEGQPAEGKPSEGKPSEGKPSEGQPSPGQPSEGQPSEGSPSDQSPSGSPQDSQKTPGREELERAKRDMENAIEQLKKKKRTAASDAQDDAIANLQKAKEKLEEILKQLREEERERFLAMLEARFQRMLAMQLLVYDNTSKLDKTPAEERSDRHAARALQLARQEEEIAIEATKAITLLREEGSAVAFPEAVEQMRDDMRIVVSRLERTEIGDLTQGIEKEIIDALEEMIDALQKEMDKAKDKKKQESQQQESQQAQQEPELVDKLAELKMLRTLQMRINHRTKRLGRMVEGEQALDADIVGQLQNLAERQARIQRAAYDMATGRNR
ncbi:MAG: hypothetical protein JSS02_31985 [Planctomycetes bacterium]|nr:hypothetical protein [Planctomycetota bacterium]